MSGGKAGPVGTKDSSARRPEVTGRKSRVVDRTSPWMALQGRAGNRTVAELAGLGPGRPLEQGTRQEMEARFGADFGAVRVHTGRDAAVTARTLAAKAFTSGRDIAFGEGRYAPGTGTGKTLLAHELAHVVQQTQRTGAPAPTGQAEAEAAQAGAHVAAGQPAAVQTAAAGVQRDPDPNQSSNAHSTPKKVDLRQFGPGDDEAMRRWLTAPAAPPSGPTSNAHSSNFTRQGPPPPRTLEETIQAVNDAEAKKHQYVPSPELKRAAAESQMPDAELKQHAIAMQEQARKEREHQKYVLHLPDGTVIDLTKADNKPKENIPAGERTLPLTVEVDGKSIELAPANVTGQRARIVRALGVNLRATKNLADGEWDHWQQQLAEWKLVRKTADIIANVDPPSFTLLTSVYDALQAGWDALGKGQLNEANAQLERASKKLAFAMTAWHRYRNANIGGAEDLEKGLEYTRDASFTTLAILGSGGGLAGAIALGAPIVAEVGGLGVRYALGEKIGWNEVGETAANIGVQLVLAKFGGKVPEGLLAAVMENPAAKTMGTQFVKHVITAEIMHAGSTVLSSTATAGVHALAGKNVTWEQLRDDIERRLSDPKGWAMAAVTAAVTAGVEQRLAAAAPPAPGKPPTPPKAGAKPVTKPTVKPPAKLAAALDEETAQANDVEPVQGPPASGKPQGQEAEGAAAAGSGQKRTPSKSNEVEEAQAAAQQEAQQQEGGEVIEVDFRRKADEETQAMASGDRRRRSSSAVTSRSGGKGGEREAAPAKRGSRKAAGKAGEEPEEVAEEPAAKKDPAEPEEGATGKPGATAAGATKGEVVKFGPEERAQLIEFWRGKIARARKPELKERYKEFLDNVQNGRRPHWRQSEMEMEFFYKQVGGSGERGFKAGRKARWVKTENGWVREGKSTWPDVVANALVEIKNYAIENKSQLLAKLKAQVEARREQGPANIKQQAIILDLRGQKVEPAQIDSLITDVAASTGVPQEMIQVLVW